VTPAFEPVPAELDRVLDPAWLTWALDDVGAGDRVVAVEAVGSTATLAQKIRFRVEVEDAAGARRERTYCVKGHFDGGSDTLRPEARFYREIRPAIGMRTPRAYYAAVDEAAGRSVVVMDDLVADGARFLRAEEPFALDTCRQSVAQLARLHADTWGDGRWDDADWLRARIGTMHRMFPDGALQGLLDDGRAAEVTEPALRDEARLRAALDRTATLPVTCVIHGDTHSNNVYVDADDRAGWLDWQVVQRGHWAVDVAYHLGTTLDVDGRRAHEADLLRHYLDALAACGVEPPSWDDAWSSYASSFAHGYLLWVITRVASRDWVLLNVPRLATAMADHDTYGRLGVS
jgi:hypothetical protein